MRAALQAPPLTFTGAMALVKQGIGNRLARFASYHAASPTNTTTIGSRIGSNPNSSFAEMQRAGLQFTAENVFKNCSLGSAYIGMRINYCSASMTYIPATGDTKLDADIKDYLHGDDGLSGVFGEMGVDCSMQDAFSRTADLETPIRGDAGLIWHHDGNRLRLMEFSGDQLGEPYTFTQPRLCGLKKTDLGEVHECSGREFVYYAGRYFKGCDCVAYKVYERTNSYYGSATIYDAQDVIYFRDPSSFRGVRGVTKFATAIQHMEKGETLFQSGMDAANRQSRTAIAVYNERGGPDDLTYQSLAHSDGSVTYRERIPNSPMTEYFYTGDRAEFQKVDSPGPELIQGVETSDERVALALWVTYGVLVNGADLGGATARLEIERSEKEFGRIQNKIHRPRLKKVSYTTIMNGVREGDLPAHPNVTKGRWQLPIPMSVDSGYDNDENVKNLRAGLESPQALIAEVGRDWKDVLRDKKQAAIDVAMTVEDANRELIDLGYRPTVTSIDVAQLTDNPVQAPPGAPTTITDTRTTPSASASAPAVVNDNIKNLSAKQHQQLARVIRQFSRGQLTESAARTLLKTGLGLDPEDIDALLSPDEDTAKMSAFVGDVSIGELTQQLGNSDLEDDIRQFVPSLNERTRVIRYQMTVPELLHKADAHNLATAQTHLVDMSPESAAQEVHEKEGKFILIINDRIVDGHHFLAKADKGSVTKSLPVIDLTPTRFQ